MPPKKTAETNTTEANPTAAKRQRQQDATTAEQTASNEEEPVVECVDLSKPRWADIAFGWKKRDEKTEQEWPEQKLMEFMFAHCTVPEQRRVWHEQIHPKLQGTMLESLQNDVGGEGVTNLIAAHLEPASSELCNTWPLELRKGDKAIEYSDDEEDDSCEEEDEEEEEEEEEDAKKKKKKAAPSKKRKQKSSFPSTTDKNGVVHDVRDSHYGGIPYLREDEDWPSAKSMNVKRRRAFIFQLRLSQLPAEMGHAFAIPGRPLADQLIQAFGGGNTSYQDTVLCRLIDCSGPARPNVTAPEGVAVYRTQHIVGFKAPLRDYPNTCQWPSAGVRVPAGAPLCYYEDHFNSERNEPGKFGPRRIDKISGWGIADRMVHGAPRCCDEDMALIMQVMSETVGFEIYGSNVPLLLSQCVKDKMHLQFRGWVEVG